MMTACGFGGDKKTTVEKNLEEIGMQNVAEEIPGIEIHKVKSTIVNFKTADFYAKL